MKVFYLIVDSKNKNTKYAHLTDQRKIYFKSNGSHGIIFCLNGKKKNQNFVFSVLISVPPEALEKLSSMLS